MRPAEWTLIVAIGALTTTGVPLAAGEPHAAGSVEGLSCRTEGDGVVVVVATSMPPPRYSCQMPSTTSRDVVLSFPEAENRVQGPPPAGCGLVSVPTVDLAPSGQKGVTIRIGAIRAVLTDVEQGPQGLLVRFARPAPAETSSRGSDPQEYRIGVGDKLEITVFGHEDLTKIVEVRGDGNISYPLIGELPVAGRTVSELNDAITRTLGKDYLVDPQVSVEVREYQSQWVTILGEVRTPGRYVLRRNMRLIDVLAEAGGATKEAGDEIVLTRHLPGAADNQQIAVSRDRLLGGEDRDSNLMLMHGDVITVQEQKAFYIRGEVIKPGSYYLSPGMTVLKAVSVAGGLSPFANRKEIDLLRTNASGVSQKISINLKAIEDGKKEDVPVLPNDIVIVPRRIF